MWDFIAWSWTVFTGLFFRGVMIHRCIAMHRYFVTMIRIDMADPMYRDSHETMCTGILENDWSKHILLIWSDWWKYTDITQWSHVGSTSGSCSSRYSIYWSSRLCAVLLFTGVSAFMLLMMPLWHLTVFRCVSRYVLYRDLCIEILIVLWSTHIVTPLLFLLL